MNVVPFHKIPGVPSLVSDLLEDRARVDFGYPIDALATRWREKSRMESAVERPRELLARRLLAQNEGLDLSAASRENISALTDPATLTVVTGQQVGLGGGPLLTLYKALTAVNIARRIETESGIRTVPLFWMATADHNLQEAAQLHWIDLDNRITGISFNGDENHAPVGNLPLGKIAVELIERLNHDLPDSEFRPEIIDRLKAAYQPEETFGRAFQRLGNILLGDYGLVMFDPEDVELKKTSGSFWVRAVSDVDNRLARLTERSNNIQAAGYRVQAQVSRGRPAIFLLEDGVRRKVVLEGRVQRALSDVIISRDELLEIAEKEPERLSAGVTLRPLYQGFLLPVGAYIAGPHEMAYWAQLPDAFEPCGVSRPAVIHRATMTLLESKIKRRIRSLNVEPEAFFLDIEELTRQLLHQVTDGTIEQVFEDIRNDSNDCRRRLMEQATEEYAGLDQSIDNAFRKIQYQLQKLENAFSQRLRQKHGKLVNSIEVVANHIRPAGSLQERVISPHYYLARYGLGLLDHLLEQSARYREGHRFVALEELSR